MSQVGNSELIATVNNRLVLQTVRTLAPTFRAEVSRRTGLKPATVTGIVNDLLARGVLTETPTTPRPGSGGGRPPLMLRVNGDHRHILAIDIEAQRIRVARTNLLVEVIDYRETAIDRSDSAESVCQQAVALAGELTSPDDGQLDGVGISVPGLIDAAAGIALGSTNMPRWRNVPVRQWMQDQLGLPVRMGRSIHLAALHESWLTPQQANGTTIAVSLRAGIGAAVIHRGQMYRGRMNFDGELGHTIVAVDGPVCDCGNRGCLEAFVSAASVVARAQQAIEQGQGGAIEAQLAGGQRLRPELIYQLASQGDPASVAIVQDVGRYLGLGVVNLINLFAPDEIVLCGSIDLAERLFVQAVQQQVEQSALPQHRQQVHIRLSTARERSSLLGAGVLVAQDWFRLPRLQHPNFANDPADDAVATAASVGYPIRESVT